MALADERDELLADQARARAVEHRRRQAERATTKASTPPAPERDEAKVANVLATSAPAPDRPLSRQERFEAEELASCRRAVWLPSPIVDPVSGLRVHGFDPENVPLWLQEVLDAA